jgi:2-keto-myo-inositol isomerase
MHKVELRNDLQDRGIIDEYEPEHIVELLNRYDLKVITINALQKFNLASRLGTLQEELSGLIDLACSIGCPAIVLCPNNDPNDSRDADQVFSETVTALQAFAPLLERGERWGYIEPLGFSESSLRSLETAYRVIQESGRSCYKIVHDTFHHHLGPDTLSSLSAGYDISCTGLIHVSGVEEALPDDQYRDGHRLLTGPNDRLNSREQIRFLEKLGYTGDISFEPFSEEVQNMPLGELENRIKDSIAYLGE